MSIHLCRDMSDVQMFRKSLRVSPEVGRAGEAELWRQNTPQVEQKFKNCVSSERSSCAETETHNTQQQVCRSSSIFLMTLMKLAQMVLVVMLPGCLDSHRMRVRSSRSSISSSSPPKSNLNLSTSFQVSFVTFTLMVSLRGCPWTLREKGSKQKERSLTGDDEDDDEHPVVEHVQLKGPDGPKMLQLQVGVVGALVLGQVYLDRESNWTREDRSWLKWASASTHLKGVCKASSPETTWNLSWKIIFPSSHLAQK